MAACEGRPPELAEIFRAHAPPLEQLGRDRRRVVRDIVSCRTPLLGGHLQVCDHCGRQIPFYNSCRNRHCPKCQSLEQTRWVEAQTRSLLPVEYFHLVFTVPTALHPFFLAGRRGSYALLFEAALETLHDVCRRRLGALPGTIAVLHTWTQTLAFHPHVDGIVTGGGLEVHTARSPLAPSSAPPRLRPSPHIPTRSREPQAYNPHIRAQPRFSPTRCFRRRASITGERQATSDAPTETTLFVADV